MAPRARGRGGASVVAHHRRAVGTDRLHRIRRPARAHRVAARPVRRTQAVDQPARVRGRHRGVQPAARPGIDPARHLLRLARRRPAGSDRRWRRVHRARARAHPRPRRAVPRRRAAHLGPRRRGRRGCRGRRGRGARRHRPRSTERHPCDGAVAVGALRAARRHRGRNAGTLDSSSCCSPAASSRSHSTRSGGPARSERTSGPSLATTSATATGGVLALVWVAFKVGALVVRRRVRHHPAHARRRRAPLPLDDQRAVPRRRRARPNHARPGHRTPSPSSATPPRASRVVCSPRSSRSSLVRVRAPRRLALRPPPPRPHAPRAFLNGAGPAAIGAIIGVAIPLALALEHAWQYGLLAAAAIALFPLHVPSSSPWSVPASWARSPPSSELHSHERRGAAQRSCASIRAIGSGTYALATRTLAGQCVRMHPQNDRLLNRGGRMFGIVNAANRGESRKFDRASLPRCWSRSSPPAPALVGITLPTRRTTEGHGPALDHSRRRWSHRPTFPVITSSARPISTPQERRFPWWFGPTAVVFDSTVSGSRCSEAGLRRGTSSCPLRLRPTARSTRPT